MKSKTSLFLFSVISMSFSNSVLNMSHDEYCLNNNKVCKGFYDRAGIYSVNCKQQKCHAIHSQNCENKLCSTSKKACSNLFPFNKLIWLIPTKYGQDKIMEKYNSVIQNINPCPFIKYEQKGDDVCLNTRSCMYMETHMKDKYGKKHLVCPCFGKTSYHCDARYCALDSRACDAFKANNSRQINQCASFNVFAQRKLNII